MPPMFWTFELPWPLLLYMYIDSVANSIECFKFAYKQSSISGKFLLPIF